MPDPIVSLADIQRHAEEAAAGHCPHSACLWPADSAAAQIFHGLVQALQVARSHALMNKETPMSNVDAEMTATMPIERTALVTGGVNGSQQELGRDLRIVAMEAAGTWSRALASSHSDPEEFARKVALAYLAALRELNAGFVPGIPDSEGHV